MASPEFLKPKPFLSLENATFRLGDRLIFENTSWAYQRHQQWAIIGPNGSGKSVLADGLRGRIPLVQGDMRYHFRPPRGLSGEEAIGHVAFEDRKSEVHGMVVQSRWTSFEEEGSLLVQDFLSYERVMEVNPFEVTPKHLAARPAFEKRQWRAIKLLHLGTFMSRTLLSLSNGERQRVQLARALAQPLRLLILDEPYVGLDRAMRQYLHAVLERLLRSNLRVLLITTRAEDLPSHITHLLCVDQCRVVAAGPRAPILRGPKLSRPAAAKRLECAELAPAFARRCKNGNLPIKPTEGPIQQRPPTRANIDKRKRQDSHNGPNLIELHNVTVRYGSAVILRKLNWIVREGESWALLGPNGSGKTTLLSLILGDNPQAYVNEVVVFGRRRGSGESVWHLKKKIGWVSPELQLHFDDTVSVFDVVVSGFHETIGLFEPPTPRQSAAARRWLKRFGLMDVAECPLFSLSVGLQRMTLLARALAKSPRLLILDEPCQGLDQTHRHMIIENVDALIRGGSVTAIFVTHRPEEIPPSIRQVLRLSLRAPASHQRDAPISKNCTSSRRRGRPPSYSRNPPHK
jgi:molybdate transport system ATP-binding protein